MKISIDQVAAVKNRKATVAESLFYKLAVSRNVKLSNNFLLQRIC